MYGDKCKEYRLDNTQTISIQTRVAVTVNEVNPNCFMVSKILDIVPKGILKLSMKQDDWNPKRDSLEFLICDYYNDTGDITIDEPIGSSDPDKTSEIVYMAVNADGELETAAAPTILNIGETYYYSAIFSDKNVATEWRIKLVDPIDETERVALERLIVIRDVDKHTISLRPGKSSRIKGRKFQLEVCDVNGDYESVIELEVGV